MSATAAAVLAAGRSATAGPLALLVIILLAVATVLLIRSMNARLRRLPPSFPEPPERDDDNRSP